MPDKYQFINHTADLGIKVTGQDLSDLFTNAGRALFEILTDIKKVAPTHSTNINLTADSREDLMNYWLSTLLQQFTVNNQLLAQFEIKHITEKSLSGLARGEPFDPAKHQINTEIKAVTFHELSVTHDKTGWQAQIIFDV